MQTERETHDLLSEISALEAEVYHLEERRDIIKHLAVLFAVFAFIIGFIVGAGQVC